MSKFFLFCEKRASAVMNPFLRHKSPLTLSRYLSMKNARGAAALFSAIAAAIFFHRCHEKGRNKRTKTGEQPFPFFIFILSPELLNREVEVFRPGVNRTLMDSWNVPRLTGFFFFSKKKEGSISRSKKP